MGLDISNSLFGSFHLSWAGTMWFRKWCAEQGLPGPFVGWASGFNNGDQCFLGSGGEHNALAKDWCAALEQQCPNLMEQGKSLLKDPPKDLMAYLYTEGAPNKRSLSGEEWSRRAVAVWYAILQHGIEHGDVLQYW